MSRVMSHARRTQILLLPPSCVLGMPPERGRDVTLFGFGYPGTPRLQNGTHSGAYSIQHRTYFGRFRLEPPGSATVPSSAGKNLDDHLT